MIERLLAADAALERGELDVAERLFGQVAEVDPRNAIAAVGMGRVAAGRDDAEGARAWFQRALEIDPDEAAARRLLAALEREVGPARAPAAIGAAGVESTPAAGATAEPPRVAAAADVNEDQAPPPAAPKRRSLVARFLGWLGLSRGG